MLGLWVMLTQDYGHITIKSTGSEHRDCNIKVTLNHKISVAFHNLKKYDSQHIIRALSKFDFKTSVI